MARVTILGDGGWGTAVAVVLAGNGHQVTLWGYDAEYLTEMARTRDNRMYLAGVTLPPNLAFHADMTQALEGAELAIVAIPTKFLRTVFSGRAGIFGDIPAVSLTKGIEAGTLLRPSEMLAACTGSKRLAVLSGPSHAEEVARLLPATVTVAAVEPGLAEVVQQVVMAPSLRVYTSTDPVGVELGGALKNVVGLAAGIAAGLGLGDNAMAALMTRGLAEMTRLGVAMGADPLTFAGLSGMGDLVTTCISPHGRNRAVGFRIGQGERAEEILASMHQVAEGVTTAPGALELGRRHGVELPITEQVVEILEHDKDPRQAVTDLMTRSGKDEKPVA